MAIWLPDLTARKGPKYQQIVEAIADDIAAGNLAPGAQLPPHRELAYQLGISASTTSRAYAEAIRCALLSAEVGRGTFVRAQQLPPEEGQTGSLHRAATGPIDFSRNLPLPGFAEPYIRRLLADIAGQSALSALLDYQAGSDLTHHHEAGKIWLERYGIEARLAQTIPTMGSQHGLLTILMALTTPGDLLLTENLTYMPVVAMARRLGLNHAGLAMDASGILPDAFEEMCSRARPKVLYLTSALQAPTTVTLSPQRRRAIARTAERHGVTIMEDDVFAPLKPDCPAPIAAHAPDHTIYVTSLSKAVAPGMRIGFLHAPQKLVPALHNAINLSIWMTPPLMLEIAARLIIEGKAEKLAQMQQDAAARRQALARSILAKFDFAADPHGLHMWLPLPGGWRSDSFRDQCARQGLMVSEGRNFTADPADAPQAIRICLSHEAEEARLEAGLKTLAGILGMAPDAATPVI